MRRKAVHQLGAAAGAQPPSLLEESRTLLGARLAKLEIRNRVLGGKRPMSTEADSANRRRSACPATTARERAEQRLTRHREQDPERHIDQLSLLRRQDEGKTKRIA